MPEGHRNNDEEAVLARQSHYPLGKLFEGLRILRESVMWIVRLALTHTNGDEIAELMREFLDKYVTK